ncbi:uncharacterized protein TNCV_1392801 [Trichonephila clavipes]|nr:uncharacterized protein TNCV_1392801 [Trichonephila clavipes]
MTLSRTPRSHLVLLALCKGSNMIRGTFSWHENGALVFLENKQTAMRYLDILRDQMHFAMLDFYPDSDGYFMDDYATIHRARNIQNWFVEHSDF